MSTQAQQSTLKSPNRSERSVVSGNTWIISIVVFFAASALMLAHRPWLEPEGRDEAIYDYMAQTIVRGGVPYRDVVENKAPGATYLSALAMLAGKTVGLSDVISARWWQILLLGFLSAITFQVANLYLRDAIAALSAIPIMLLSGPFLEWMSAGTEPKLPMILFGMLSLLFIAKGRPFWAGFCSMLSCLCWQPGLLFAGVAFLIFSRYLTSWRDGRALRVVLGAAVPLAVLVGYFWVVGALDDLWAWTIAFNSGVYARETAQGAAGSLALLVRVMRRVFSYALIFVAVSAAGLLVFAAERARSKIKSKKLFDSPDGFADALVIPPVIYLIFCFINFQSGPDLIPLFPFIGIFAAWVIVKTYRALSDAPVENLNATGRIGFRALPGIVLLLAVILLFSRAIKDFSKPALTLSDQRHDVEVIAGILGPGDKIYAHGMTDILVLLGKPNINPYIYLDHGKDKFLASRKPGGFKAVIGEMEAQAPKIVALSRLGKVAYREDLEQWVTQHYDHLDLGVYRDVYIRR